MNNNIPNPSDACNDAFLALDSKMRLLLDGAQIMETCEEHGMSYISWWATLCNTEGTEVANTWLCELFGFKYEDCKAKPFKPLTKKDV